MSTTGVPIGPFFVKIAGGRADGLERKEHAVTTTSPPLAGPSVAGADWPDDVVDLADRRRLFVRALFGLDLDPAALRLLFEPLAAAPPAG